AMDGTPDTALWLATARGLFAFRNHQLTPLISDTDARSVVATAPNLAWCVAAGSGLHRVLLDEAMGVIATRQNVEQGLPSEQAFALLAERDQSSIWVGTNRGLACYEPGEVSPLVSTARVMGKRLFSRDEVSAGL